MAGSWQELGWRHAARGCRTIAPLVFGVALAVEGDARGQCMYEITAIIQAPPCPFTGPPSTLPAGMNSRGEVVGSYLNCTTSGADHGYYWSAQTGFVTLPKPANMFALRPASINDAGIVAGTAIMSPVGGMGFIYDIKNPTAGYTFLPPLYEGVVATTVSSCTAINNSGIVTGSRVISKPGETVVMNAVIWRPFEPGAPVEDLGSNDPNSGALDGNWTTDAAGWSGAAYFTQGAQAILWANSTAVELGYLPGMLQSHARAMNNDLQVAGWSRASIFSSYRGFLWLGGQMEELAPPPPFESFLPQDLSDLGQLGGALWTTAPLAAIWQLGDFYQLSEHVVNLPTNVSLSGISAVGNNGWIFASGSQTGRTLSVVLTPINQPLTDLNHDCRVDMHDLRILLDAWGPAPVSAGGSGVPSPDFNGDGMVDVFDLLFLLANWGP
jgi:hypothetical protein